MFAHTPQPPYYAVIFTNQRTEGDDGYAETAERMVALAKDKLKDQQKWTTEKRQKINQSLALLEKDFQRLLQP